jgi:hypothetical protein
MAEDELSAYFASSHGMPEPCNKPPFSVFIMPLYLAYRGRWPDLTCGSLGVWAWCPKLQFQKDASLQVQAPGATAPSVFPSFSRNKDPWLRVRWWKNCVVHGSSVWEENSSSPIFLGPALEERLAG